MAYKENLIKRQHNLFWGSSYDRGLDILLFMWPQVIEKYPEAELHICYGWDMFDIVTRTNPERKQWKESVVRMMGQKGIVHHGRVGQTELKAIRKSCGIWAYPTNFPEINCITGLQAQADGLVPVTVDYAALSETVQSGVKVKGDIRNLQVQEEYVSQLLRVMGDMEFFLQESEKAREFAKGFTWEKLANDWIEEFKTPISTPLVSVCTVTIRTGFWNVMASNLANQTYKNFEWIIVDDYKTDRTEIAAKYAKKYNLNIKYVRGDKGKTSYSRKYGLVRANNLSWKNAKGELLVFLQDFLIMPDNGIEALVDLYRHNPDSLIAPVDERYLVKTPDRTNLEDWWNGNTDIFEKFDWRNIRVENLGIRKTDNAFDFEMNYGAIPKHIVDELNGWWEFFDNGLGYDNTDIALRAMNKGYTILLDDTNIAKAANLWPIIGGTEENITERERNLGLPLWIWLKRKIDNDSFPIVRDETLDASLKLEINVPAEIPDEKCAEYINEHAKEIADSWN